ncbi:MAG TPA: PHP domain-containing protein [Leptolyngbyaceae cyanobacterium M33_DOE_097]|uniref:PHP domain-containing protein n=1 Tax=Oscillatoriales cyanobacterium SpSt-418 TaxID=2282169 RepID=A0A7C3PIS7_9CYAN|nr:PHP domain-containing protein [Leptolyngbyaceae cyanobacterium M33_DOE_097]
MIELHCHTTCSDGTLTPTELVRAAAQAGVKALAITDHDTLSGWDEACQAASVYGLELIPGVELSTVLNGRSLHILGFYPQCGQLQAALQERIAGRVRRAHKMIEQLAALGYPLTMPKMPPNMAPGRPHIAKAMLDAGYVTSTQEAFERFLGDDKPAYVHYEKFDSADGIALLRTCGAVPVWAHPYLFRGGKVEDVLPELVAAGLMGIEVYHPEHRPSQSDRLKRLCEEYGLIMTGGSDYHGPAPGDRSEASSLNCLNVPSNSHFETFIL